MNATLNNLVNIIKDYADNHPMINDFGYGPLADMNDRQMRYPFMWLTLQPGSTITMNAEQEFYTVSMALIVVDQENQIPDIDNENKSFDSNNRSTILSETHTYVLNTAHFLSNLPVPYILDGQVNYDPTFDGGTAKEYGFVMYFNMKMFYSDCYNVGDINVLPPPSGLCAPVIIENSDGTYRQSLESGTELTLPNITVTITDNDDNLLYQSTSPSVKDLSFKLTNVSTFIYEINGINKGTISNNLSITILDTDGNQIGTILNDTITINDSTITINNQPFIDLLAESNLNIEVVDQDDNPVGNLINNKWTVNVGSTGQVTLNINNGFIADYNTGDTINIEVRNSNNDLIGTVNSEIITIGDSTISINGLLHTDLLPEDNLNLIVKDQFGNDVGSLIGGEWIVNIPQILTNDVSINNTLIDTLDNGEDINIPVKNTNNTDVGSLISGEWIIDDTQININGSSYQQIEAESNPLNINVVNRDNDQIGFINTNNDVEINDSDVTINSTPFVSIPAEDSLNINVVDSNNTEIGFININNKVEINDSTVTINGQTYKSILATDSLNIEILTQTNQPTGTNINDQIIIDNSTVTINNDTPRQLEPGDSINITVKDTANNEIGTINANVVEIADNVITINGQTFTNLLPEDNINILVKDQFDNLIGSLVGNEWIVTIPQFTDVEISLNGQLFNTYSSGQTDNIQIKDTNNTQVGSIVSGEFIIDDSEISINSTLLTNLNAEQPLDVPVLNSNSETVGTITNGDVIVSDATITINSDSFTTVKAEGTIDIVVKDTDGTQVGEEISGEWIVPKGGGSLPNLDRFVGIYNNNISYPLFDFYYKGSNNLNDETVNMIRNSSNIMHSLAIGNAPNKYLAAWNNGSIAPIRVTTDGGATWTTSLVISGFSSSGLGVYSMPNNRDIVYAFTHDTNNNVRIHKSTDGGDTWSLLQSYASQVNSIGGSSKRLSDDYLYIGTAGSNNFSQAYIINLTNDARTAISVSTGNSYYIKDVAYSPTLNRSVACYGHANSTNAGIGYVNGVGSTTTQAVSGGNWVSVEWVPFLNMFIAIRNTTTTGEIYTSIDGINWILRLSLPLFQYGPTIVYTSDNKVFITSGLSSYTSTDGTSWTETMSVSGIILNNNYGKIRKVSWNGDGL